MKTLCRALLLFFISVNVNAQNLGGCGNNSVDVQSEEKALNCNSTSSTWVNSYRTPGHWKSKSDVPIKTILVNWIVCQKSDGTNGWQDIPLFRSQVNEMFDSINQIYGNVLTPNYNVTCPVTVDYIADTRIRFELNEIIFIQNDDFNATADATPIMNWLHTNHPDTKYQLNHIFTMPPNQGYWGRYESFGSNAYIQTYYSMYSDFFVVWSDHINHIAHEYGHAVGLHHPYYTEGNLPITHYDFLDDLFGTCGETVCCTPAVGYVCPLSTCFWSTQPGPHPLMNGNNSQRYISPKQSGRMHRALSLYGNSFLVNNRNMHKYVKEITPYSIPLEIVQDEVWDFKIKMYQNIIVKTGNTLTIKCEVMMPNDGKIIIEPGARLIIDGGKVTNYYYLDDARIGLWSGIEVWGTTNQHQYPEVQPTYQGKLELKNGGIIENAHNGARNSKPGDYNKIGGVIISDGGIFRNNRRAIEFIQYENFHHITPSLKLNNISKFTNTNFIIDNDFLLDPYWVGAQVTMWDIYGVSFTNCHFSNSLYASAYHSTQNKAIYTIDAGYSVVSGCSTNPPIGQTCPTSNVLKSSFNGFNKAIESSGSATTKTINIDQTIFENNLFGIEINDLDNFSITRSTFTLGNPYTIPLTSSFGIIVNNSSGYIIEENSFIKPNEIAVSSTYGSQIENSGTENNRLYKNNYSNLTYGQNIIGINRNSADAYKGFQSICNNFANLNYAMRVGNTSSSHGIRSYQGDYSPIKSAGNTYNSCLNSIQNLSTWPIIYYHNGGTSTPVNNTSNVTLYSTTNANNCPSRFAGTTIRSSILGGQINLDSLLVIKENLLNTYNNLIDGGDSKNTISKITNQWAIDSWNLRDSLLSLSPYLSKKSIITAASSNVLTDLMVLELCLNNPDITSNMNFINELNKTRQLPHFMIDHIANNWDKKTQRTNFEAQIGEVNNEINLQLNDIIFNKLNAHERKIEEINKVSSLKSDLQGLIDLLEFNIEEQNWNQAANLYENATQATEILDGIEILENYINYIEFRAQLNERKLDKLEEDEILKLETFTKSKGKIASYAQNILCFFYNRCNTREENNDIIESNSRNELSDLDNINELLYSTFLSPNPALDYVDFKWEILDKIENCQYIVSNIEGLVLLKGDINENNGHKKLDIKGLSSGLYLVSLLNNGAIKANLKLLVNK